MKTTLKFTVLILMILCLGMVFSATPAVSQTQVPRATRSATTPAVRLPAPPTSTPIPTAAPVILNPSAWVLEEPLQIFLYHLGPSNRRVFESADSIPAGQLIKVSSCLENYAQVEYQPDPVAKPGMWKIVFATLDRCP